MPAKLGALCQDLANVSWAFAKLGVQNDELFEVWAGQSVLLCSASSVMPLRDVAPLQALAKQVVQKLPELGTQSSANAALLALETISPLLSKELQ